MPERPSTLDRADGPERLDGGSSAAAAAGIDLTSPAVRAAETSVFGGETEEGGDPPEAPDLVAAAVAVPVALTIATRADAQLDHFEGHRRERGGGALRTLPCMPDRPFDFVYPQLRSVQ